MQAVAHAAVKHTYFVDILQKFSTESIQPIHQISQHIDNCVSTEHVQLVHQTLQFVQFTYTIFAFNRKFLQWTSFFSIYEVC